MHAQLQADSSDDEMLKELKRLGAKHVNIEEGIANVSASVKPLLEPALQEAEDELAMVGEAFSKTATSRLSARFHAYVELHMSPAFDLPALEDLLG